MTESKSFKHLKTCKLYPRKPLRKMGTIAVDRCESTPVVFNGRILRMDVVDRNNYPNCYSQFFDAMTNEPVGAKLAEGCVFPSAYAENGTAYVITPPQTDGRVLCLYESKDLINWESREIFRAPEGWTLFNTSLCKSPDGYTIALEIGGCNDVVGEAFTIVFLRAKADDIHTWELLEPHEHCFTPERYSACPVIRWSKGYYYMIYLEELPQWNFMPYITRSKNLIDFESGIRNPVLCPSDDDKLFRFPDMLTDAEKEYILETPDVNNSDVDMCELNGKTYFVYSWGIQLGKEFIAWAEYDGPLDEFFASFYPMEENK